MSAGDVTLHQTLIPQDGGGYSVDSAEVRLQGGLPLHASVDAATTPLLARCNGARSLASIAIDIAAENGLDPDTFTPACAHRARQLIASRVSRVLTPARFVFCCAPASLCACRTCHRSSTPRRISSIATSTKAAATMSRSSAVMNA